MPLTEEQKPRQGPPIIDRLGLRHPPRWTVLEDGRVQIRVPETPSSFHAGGRHYLVMSRRDLDDFIRELEEVL